MLKETWKKAVSQHYQNPQPSIYTDKCTLYPYGLHAYCALVHLDSSGSSGVRRTLGLIFSTQVVGVCVRVFTNTHPPTTLTPTKIEKCIKQKPPSLTLSKHSLSRQQQALTMYKLKKKPISNPTLHTHAGVRKQPVIHRHVLEGLDGTIKQNTSPRVHMYTHSRVYMHVYPYIYTDTHICIHVHIHVHAHLYTEKISATTPGRVKQYHRRTYASIYICMHMHIYMHTHMCATCSECEYADVKGTSV